MSVSAIPLRLNAAAHVVLQLIATAVPPGKAHDHRRDDNQAHYDPTESFHWSSPLCAPHEPFPQSRVSVRCVPNFARVRDEQRRQPAGQLSGYASIAL